jgi:hypothetical protein
MKRDERTVALDLLRRGEITMAEAARWAGVSRMAVTKWCRAAGIDAAACRAAHVEKRWHQANAKAAGRIRRSPSKRELAGVVRSARRSDEE